MRGGHLPYALPWPRCTLHADRSLGLAAGALKRYWQDLRGMLRPVYTSRSVRASVWVAQEHKSMPAPPFFHPHIVVQTADLLPEALKGEAGKLVRGTDTMDVWFDSGSSWAAVLKQTEGLQYPADLYLEGSDQHRCGPAWHACRNPTLCLQCFHRESCHLCIACTSSWLFLERD